MPFQGPGRPNSPISPVGTPLTLDDLPPPNTKRWVIRRKAEVVAGVRSGLISLEEACARYKLSVEEFLSWQALIENHGIPGLRTTRLQEYRESSDPNARAMAAGE
ncbi:CtrA inhibitor SciP [Rhodovibrionaceae bacterium A322]